MGRGEPEPREPEAAGAPADCGASISTAIGIAKKVLRPKFLAVVALLVMARSVSTLAFPGASSRTADSKGPPIPPLASMGAAMASGAAAGLWQTRHGDGIQRTTGFVVGAVAGLPLGAAGLAATTVLDGKYPADSAYYWRSLLASLAVVDPLIVPGALGGSPSAVIQTSYPVLLQAMHSVFSTLLGVATSTALQEGRTIAGEYGVLLNPLDDLAAALSSTLALGATLLLLQFAGDRLRLVDRHDAEGAPAGVPAPHSQARAAATFTARYLARPSLDAAVAALELVDKDRAAIVQAVKVAALALAASLDSRTEAPAAPLPGTPELSAVSMASAPGDGPEGVPRPPSPSDLDVDRDRKGDSRSHSPPPDDAESGGEVAQIDRAGSPLLDSVSEPGGHGSDVD